MTDDRFADTIAKGLRGTGMHSAADHVVSLADGNEMLATENERLVDLLRSAHAVIKRMHEAGFNPAILDRIHEALDAHTTPPQPGVRTLDLLEHDPTVRP